MDNYFMSNFYYKIIESNYKNKKNILRPYKAIYI